MPHAHHPNPTTADTLYESLYSGAVGGTVIAVFFLIADSLTRSPLETPSLLGSILFFGGTPTSTSVRLDAVAYITAVHFAAFGFLGAAASVLVRRIELLTGGSFMVPALALFVLLELGFKFTALLFLPGAADIIGQGKIIMANALTAAAMTSFLRAAHISGEPGSSGSGANERHVTPT